MNYHTMIFVTLAPFSLLSQAAPDTTTSIAVYAIKSEVISKEFSATLSDHIETTLIGLHRYNVIARSNLDVLITEDHLLESGIIAEEQNPNRTGLRSTVDKICTGSVSGIGAGYNITLKIIDVATGRIESSMQRYSEGPVDGLLGISDTLIRTMCGSEVRQDKRNSANTSTHHAGLPLHAADSGTVTPIKQIPPRSSGETSALRQPQPLSLLLPVIRDAPVKKNSSAEPAPSGLGKRISIGAAAIFGTLAGILLLSRI
jgi:hypothetical protein